MGHETATVVRAVFHTTVFLTAAWTGCLWPDEQFDSAPANNSGESREEIFSDGFESGDASAWSVVIGLACDECLPAVDAAVQWSSAQAFFFRGDSYIEIDIGLKEVTGGPGSVSQNWLGWPASWNGETTSGLNYQTGKTYFFRKDQYLRYDIANDAVDPGFPVSIVSGWGGWPSDWADGIDAVLMGNDGKVYFFRHNEYLRYDIADDSVDPGFPKLIVGNWAGWPPSWADGVDAAVNWGAGKALFFRGDEYLSYDLVSDVVDLGYPALIAVDFVGWPDTWVQEH